jgi:hypothetical protein
MSPVKARRARENSAIVRKLLRQRQPEFAAALASAEHYLSCLVAERSNEIDVMLAHPHRDRWRLRQLADGS